MDPERVPEPQPEEMPKGIGAVEITLTAFIVLLLIGTGAYYFLNQKTVGGYAALNNPDTAGDALEKFFDKAAFKFVGDGAICVIASIQGKDESFAVRKANGLTTVRRAGVFGCDGLGAPNILGVDFIIRYTDPLAFAKHITAFECGNFMDGSGKAGYIYLPSGLWREGKNAPECNAEFRKYCALIAYCIEPTAVPGGVFECCAASHLSPLQLEQVNEARRLGTQSGNRQRDAPKGK